MLYKEWAVGLLGLLAYSNAGTRIGVSSCQGIPPPGCFKLERMEVPYPLCGITWKLPVESKVRRSPGGPSRNGAGIRMLKNSHMASGVAEFLIFLLIIIVIKESLAEAADVVLGTTPPALESSGDSVTISWSGLDSPTEFDWLGIYTPSESPDEQYIGYILLSSCASWISGACNLTMPLVNMRAPYQFRLFRGRNITRTRHTRLNGVHEPLPTTEHRLAASENVNFKSYNEPTQVHLSLTSQQVGEMKVMFVTRDAIDCVVRYGLQVDKLGSVRKADHTTYRQTDMCDAPANTSEGWRDPGYLHTAVMDGLNGGRRYVYQVGSEVGGWSTIFSFVASQANAEETHALIFGDMGTTAPYTTYQKWAPESEHTCICLNQEVDSFGDKPLLVAHIGDLSYARGYAWVWDEFFHRIQGIAARAPYHVCIGNHEYNWPEQPWRPDWASNIYHKDGGGECGVPYSVRFQMPGNSSLATGTSAPATKNLFFSHAFGVVHFLYISTETDMLPGSEQLAFIASDLAGVDRQKTPFVVLMGHRPMYTSTTPSEEVRLRSRMMEHIEPLMIEHKVDLALWGHVHKYERTCHVNHFACENTTDAAASRVHAPVHMVIGVGGQDWQTKWASAQDHPDLPYYPQPSWSMFRSTEFGYARLHATRNLLTVSYIGNRDGEVHDVVRIYSGLPPTRASSFEELGSRMLGWLVGLPILVALVAVVCYTQNKRSQVDQVVSGMPYSTVSTHEMAYTGDQVSGELSRL